MNTKLILTQARELLEKDGWLQGSYYCMGQRCADGALRRSAMDLVERDQGASWTQELAAAQATLVAAIPLSQRTVGRASAIHYWNDHQGRTKEEVLRAFDKAIEMAA